VEFECAFFTLLYVLRSNFVKDKTILSNTFFWFLKIVFRLLYISRFLLKLGVNSRNFMSTVCLNLQEEFVQWMACFTFPVRLVHYGTLEGGK
jgi:hypothetical protein